MYIIHQEADKKEIHSLSGNVWIGPLLESDLWHTVHCLAPSGSLSDKVKDPLRYFSIFFFQHQPLQAPYYSGQADDKNVNPSIQWLLSLRGSSSSDELQLSFLFCLFQSNRHPILRHYTTLEFKLKGQIHPEWLDLIGIDLKKKEKKKKNSFHWHIISLRLTVSYIATVLNTCWYWYPCFNVNTIVYPPCQSALID